MDGRPKEIGDRRWIVLGEDGRIVTLGRATDPSEEEITQVEAVSDRRGWRGGSRSCLEAHTQSQGQRC